MKLQLRIKRQDPERSAAPYWAEYEVEVEPTDRLLDALHKVKWYQDGTLAFRRSCGHGICGSDVMLINGKNLLACKVLVKEVAPHVRVEPLRGFRVLKDLIVDMEAFFAKSRALKPYLMPAGAEPERERHQSPADRQRYGGRGR